jgi:DNA mismatch repair ATPase MutS
MVDLKELTAQYLKRKNRYHELLLKLEKSFQRVIKLKLAVLLAGLFITILFVVAKRYAFSGGALFLGIMLLILLDIKHQKIQQQQKYTAILKDMNEQAVWRFDQRWSSFTDTGEEFKDENHPYVSDLDIFGKSSLFQLINVSHTFKGRKRLAHLLTVPPDSIAQIMERQEAVVELAEDLKWRQRLSALGIMIADKSQDPGVLINWAQNGNPFFRQKTVITAIRSLTIFTICVLALFFFSHKVPFYLPLGAVLLQYIILKIKAKQRSRVLETVFYYRKNLELYRDLLEHIGRKNFTTTYLQSLKAKLFNAREQTASIQLGRLVKIADQISTRQHALYGVFNTLTLWDYHCLIALENWKEKSGRSLKHWLETVAEIEALASLATLSYDHPDWVSPKLTEKAPVYAAKNLGHPLLSGTVRKGNDLLIEGQTNVLLITGSNMSGKSTFLRTAGINLVLAYAGAPVCAKSFICSQMNIYTCMRVSDNLEKNISTFYAELLRIKMIVEATVDKKPTFFLLDEIFKGTNSIDRHNGAKVLIKKLIQNGAVGLVSTHDLELGELERECRMVKNYHFQEFFRDGQLCFDYQLRPGVSTTRNALYLMRAAGIDVD